MKFTEAIQKCYENPGKTYERFVTGSDKRLFMKYASEEKNIVFSSDNEPDLFFGGAINEDDIKADWKPAPQEVTWQKALEAWTQKNKTIKCILPTEKSEFLCINKEHIIDRFQSNVKLLSKLIEYGKWYILED